MELAFPTNGNKRAWALDSFTIVPGSLGVSKSKCRLHYLFMSQVQQALEAEIQMLKFEEHQGESSTKFLHSHCWNAKLLGLSDNSVNQMKNRICACSLEEQKRACKNGGTHCQVSSGSGNWEIFVG